jgi:preprotein translocase subunit SecD
MLTSLGGSPALTIAVLILFCYGIVGIPRGSLKQSISERINLGLDLKGGIHLVLAVQMSDALRSATDRDAAKLEAALEASELTGVTVGRADSSHLETISITGVPIAKMGDVRSLLEGSDYSIYDIATQPDGAFILTMKHAAIESLEAKTLVRSIETIRRRVNSLGLTEATVQKYGLGENQILVELPGLEDPTRVEEVIKSTAKLEIHAVGGGPYADEAAALQANHGVIPFDSLLMQGAASAGAPVRWYLLKRSSEVEGTDLRDAQPSEDMNGRPNILFTLTSDAGDRFYRYTSEHSSTSATPGTMAIVLENRVQEVMGIDSAIRDRGEIEGGFTKQQAADLSLMLRTGALPASISYLETRTVGPSLGATSIRRGVQAAVAGLLLVMAFMLLYYRGAGINAVLALLLNLLVLLGFMGFLKATLTLPGIAGVILTVGMGVDSNVLIFERIREELRTGKSAATAVKEGFAHAWKTILDTHVTTVVSAAILFLFGTGPIQGFALTLTMGLIGNLFTAVFVSRLIFDTILQKKGRTATLSI